MSIFNFRLSFQKDFPMFTPWAEQLDEPQMYLNMVLHVVWLQLYSHLHLSGSTFWAICRPFVKLELLWLLWERLVFFLSQIEDSFVVNLLISGGSSGISLVKWFPNIFNTPTRLLALSVWLFTVITESIQIQWLYLTWWSWIIVPYFPEHYFAYLSHRSCSLDAHVLG